MRRALQLAAQADHATSPNPMVGCVVLDPAGEPAGEGYHRGAGEAHAEALGLARAGSRARGGTVYVNLEPCSHQGRTPPCAAALVVAGVGRVVVAQEDPDPRVAGAGIRLLRKAGIEVEVGVEEKAASRLNRFYLKHRRTGLPYVTMKFAMSLDGRIATTAGESRWITGAAARAAGHELRHIHDAVLVGIGTVLADDPQLTDRRSVASRQPLRVVVDSTLRTPLGARLLEAQEGRATLIATTSRAEAEGVAALERKGAEVVRLPAAADGLVDLSALLALLGSRGVLSVLAEGGSRLHGGLLDIGAVDAVAAFVAPILIGGVGAPAPVAGAGGRPLADALRLAELDVVRLGDDLMISGECSRG